MRFFTNDETVHVELKGSEVCQCESDAVVTATTNTVIEGTMQGGILSSAARKFLTGETFFMQSLSSSDRLPASIVLAPKCPGEAVAIDELPKAGLVLTQGAFIAAASTVNVQSQMQGSLVNSAFSGTGLFTLNLNGYGPVAFAGFGKIITHHLNANETLLVDNGHLVGWTGEVQYTMQFANTSLMSSFKSGEGLMCNFRGPGTVYVQSRNPSGYQEWLASQLKGSKQESGSQVGGCCAGFLIFLFLVVFAGFGILIALYGEPVEFRDNHERIAHRQHYR